LDLLLVYAPSPRSRLTGGYNYRYEESDLSTYGGQTSSEFRFTAQHDVTAKILAKAIVRCADIEYDKKDGETGAGKSDEERLDLIAELRYKINRLNFLELRLKHSEKTYDSGAGDWDQNMIDVGWRVEL